MISIQDLQVTRSQKTILSVGKLQVNEGERVVIEGVNGSGKTTLLKVIGGLANLSTGDLSLDCQQTEITYVHQNPFLFRGTVRQNLLCVIRSKSISNVKPKSAASAPLEQWCRALNVHQLLDQPTRHLSGGERKKVALIRGLLIEPKVLLADEPLSDLDNEAAMVLIDRFQSLKSTTIVATSPTGDQRFAGFRRLQIEQL